MKNGIQTYKAKDGWRTRLWSQGRIIAEGGESYANKSEAKLWGVKVFKAVASGLNKGRDVKIMVSPSPGWRVLNVKNHLLFQYK